MTVVEIKEMVQGWIDDINCTGFDIANVDEEIREKLEKMSPEKFSGYVTGQIDALESVINSL